MDQPTVCLINIGPKESRKRLVMGIGTLAVGLILAALFVLGDVERKWRMVLLLPFWMGALGVFQAQRKTWVSLAARGTRNMDSGEETIGDSAEQDALRSQSRKVHIESAATGIALTLLFLLILR